MKVLTVLNLWKYQLWPQWLQGLEEHLLDQFLTSQTVFFQQYRQLKMVEKLAYLDDATDLFNQRKLKIDLEYVVEQYKNYGQKFSLLFLDIDYFKTVNDNFGHIVGTELLSEVAKEMRTVLRDIDWVYRYGGDEFVVIMTGIEPDAAKLVGERILSTVKSW